MPTTRLSGLERYAKVARASKQTFARVRTACLRTRNLLHRGDATASQFINAI